MKSVHKIVTIAAVITATPLVAQDNANEAKTMSAAAQLAPAAGAATPAEATVTAAPVQQVNPGQTITLPANTELLLRLSQEVNSKLMKEGATFRVSLAQDVRVGNYIVLPKGTPGTGYISYRTGKGAFGKSAKMEITMRSLDMPNGTVIGLSGMTRQEGQGNTGATVGTAVAAGVFAAFVTGRSAIFQEGREVRGFTKEAVSVTIPN